MGTSMLERFLPGCLLDYSGQSIVEIGLVTPFLLVALYVPIDFGIAYYTAHLTQNAVREAARIGVSTKDPFDNAAANDIAAQARDRLPLRLKPVTVTVEYFGPASATCMQSVSVTAAGSYDYFFYQMLRLVGATVLDNPVQISRVTRMRYEFQPVTNSTPACGPTPSVTGTASRT
jgi:Flp pilus assembly protein TadG